ncbi:CG5196 [Drosophila busckii]|uniref:Palmitoyltransferase n=1 Tax=Drosophila busckii TaxID=30019 RepID=A0A0M4E990_DROBS|nr:palmitoyltransferase ZDHHC6 [Drosophila busckii]ALC43616.1 CG5196 [Drosophila busckii]
MTEAEENELRLFWHWGPMVSLILTLTVVTTTYIWWPVENHTRLSAHFGLYMLLYLLALYNFVMSVLMGPGLLPKHWQPKEPKDTRFLQYCHKCEGYKAPRAHHCRRCKRCVLKMDHHCPWINRCVGWANHAYFVYFLFFYLLGSIHSAVVLACGLYQFVSDNFMLQPKKFIILVQQNYLSVIMCVTCFCIALGTVLTMIKLLVIQMYAILTNCTDIEQWIWKKAQVRRYCSQQQLQPFVHPYHLGWYGNLGQVFNMDSQYRSRGIDWPMRANCDQYALTIEQLAQKADKRNRTRIYRCVKRATGSWLPLWSQGLMVTLCLPCTDDPRIVLEPNDLVRVTRIGSHWLFGERVLSELEERRKQPRPGALRGWFPRPCAVDITETSNCKDQSNKSNFKYE